MLYLAAAVIGAVILSYLRYQSGHRASVTPAPPENDEFHDFAFAIVGERTGTLGRELVLGPSNDRPMVSVALGRTWTQSQLGTTGINTFRGEVTFQPSGPDPRAFAAYLDSAYRVGIPHDAVPSRATFTGLSLEGNPGDLDAGPVKIKLFHEPGADSDYAEVYLNIDLSHRVAELAEKDPDYRRALLRAFLAKR